MELNGKQQEVLKEFRSEWAEYQSNIETAKTHQKELFESLWEALAWEKKERGDDIKAVKAGFMLYYKDNAKEAEQHVGDAVEIAAL